MKKNKTKENNSSNIKINQQKLEQLKNNELTSNALLDKQVQSEQNITVQTENNTKEQNTELINTVTENKQKPLTKKQEWFNLLKFVLFSISAGVIQIATFTLLSELVFLDADIDYGISYFISLALSVVWNFTFNRKFTFKSAKNVPIAMLLVFVFYCAFTPLSIWWGIALTDFAGWNKYIVLALTMVINFITEYLWTRFVVYRNNINTAKPKEKKEKVKKIKQPKTKKRNKNIK